MNAATNSKLQPILYGEPTQFRTARNLSSHSFGKGGAFSDKNWEESFYFKIGKIVDNETSQSLRFMELSANFLWQTNLTMELRRILRQPKRKLVEDKIIPIDKLDFCRINLKGVAPVITEVNSAQNKVVFQISELTTIENPWILSAVFAYSLNPWSDWYWGVSKLIRDTAIEQGETMRNSCRNLSISFHTKAKDEKWLVEVKLSSENSRKILETVGSDLNFSNDEQLRTVVLNQVRSQNMQEAVSSSNLKVLRPAGESRVATLHAR